MNRWTPQARQAQAERMLADNPRHRHEEHQVTAHTTAARALDHVTRALRHFPIQLELDVTT